MSEKLQHDSNLKALTSLRFVAALAVVLSHLFFLRSTTIPVLHWVANKILVEGCIGVAFFFTLSGFILSESYGERFLSGSVRLRDFYIARVARIAPLHVFTICMIMPLALVEAPSIGFNFLFRLVANASFIQSFAPSRYWYYSFNAPAWSLSVEMFFYAIFPILILKRSRILGFIAVFIIGVKILLGAIGDFGNVEFFQLIFPPLRVADFIIGIILNRLFRRYYSMLVKAASPMQIFSVFLISIFAIFSSFVPEWLTLDVYYMIPVSLVVLAFAFNSGCAARVVSGKSLILLGESSFALYLVHHIIIRYGEAIVYRLGIVRTPLVDIGIAFVYVALSLLLALLLFKYFEMHAKLWVRNVLSSKLPAWTRGSA